MTRKTLGRLALVAVVAAGIALGVAYRQSLTPERLQEWIGALGVWGPIVYTALYVAAPSLFIPGAAITLAAGALFGPVWGTLYAVIGSVTGSALAFLLARYLAGEWVERRASGMLRQVKEGVDAEGWRFVAFVRLVPLFPFNLLNYVLGLTGIPLRTYVLTSAICMFPGTVGYVYLGYAGREALLGGQNLVQKITIALAVFAVLVFLPLLVRRMRSMRKAALGAAGAPGGTPKGATE